MAHAFAEQTIAVSSEHGLVQYLSMANIVKGWALAKKGSCEKGIELIYRGLEQHEAIGARLIRPHLLALLAEALGDAGLPEEGLGVLLEAFALSKQNNDCYYDAELHRLKGELLLTHADHRARSDLPPEGSGGLDSDQHPFVAAEACFQEALKIAQKQKAKSWELRAALSIALLYERQDRNGEAHKILDRTYCLFSEGFETTDLTDAKRMLDHLRA